MMRCLSIVLLLATSWYVTANHEDAGDCAVRRRGIIEGNVTLGFMFPFYGSLDDSLVCDESSIPSPENIQLLEAALHTIRLAENRFPDINIGLEAYDSCYSTNVAVDLAVAFLSDRQLNYTCGSKIKPGFVGSLDGERGPVLASIKSNAQVGTTGYAATSPDIPDVTRMVPSDVEEALVMTRFLNRIGWNYVHLVIAGDQDGRIAVNFLEAAASAGICVSLRFPLNATSTALDVTSVYSAIFQNNALPIVVIGDDSSVVRQFLDGASSYPLNLQAMMSYQPFLDVMDSIDNDAAIFSALPEVLYTTGTIDNGFDDYFRNLNLDTYDHVANPWFHRYWETKYNCSTDGDGQAMCGAEAVNAHSSSYERHPYVTAVVDAISAHLEVLEATCLNGSCTPEGYVEALKAVNFTSGAGTSRRVAFHPNGDPEGNRFVIVGKLNGVESMIAQSSNGNFGPISSDFVVKPSKCADPCTDLSCFSPDEMEGRTDAYVGGDLVLAGFFPVNEWNEELSQCGALSTNGALYVEAMRFAVDMINKDDTILPNITLGFDGYNTCDSPQKATDLAIDLLNKGSFDLSHSATRRSPDGSRLEHFFGIVGPKRLETVGGVNRIVSTKKVPMVGYAVDDPTISTYSYPYLARALPATVTHIHPMLRYMSEIQISYFQVVYTDGLPGARTALSYLGTGSWTGVCRSQETAIPNTDDQDLWDAFFVNLQKTPDAKALYLLATGDDVRRVLQNMDARQLQGKYFLISGPSWRPTADDVRNYKSAKGALVFTSKREYTGFKDYLSRIDPTENPTGNPWMADYWMNTFGCTLSPGGGNTCTGQENLLDIHEEDEAIPRIIDSVYALAVTIHNLQLEFCPGSQRVCSQLLGVDGDTFVDSLRSRTSFTSINDDRTISFDYSLMLDYSYEVLNVQDEGIVQIGTLKSFAVTPIPGTSLKFYGPDGTEFSNPDGTVSRCTTANCIKSCERPDTDTVAESYRDGTGDIWLGGFFELSAPAENRIECSNEIILENMQLLEAFLYAIDTINQNNVVLPFIKLSGIGFDSCGSKNRVIKEAGNFVLGTVDYRTAYATQIINAFGIIGGSNSDTTSGLSDTVSSLGLNQLSYAATASEFSDTSRHPYLMRTVPSDVNQARVFIDVMNQFGWSYVSIVYSDNLYGNDMLKTFTDNLESGTICVAMTLRVGEDFGESDFTRIIEILQNNPSSRTVALFTSDVDTRSVLQAAKRQGVTDIQWIGSDTWGSNEYVIGGVSTTVQGAITIRFENRPVQPFVDYFSTLSPYANSRNPWFRQYFADVNKCLVYGIPQVYDTPCPYPFQTPKEIVTNPLISSVINAVYAYAYGLHAALEELCPDVPNHHICSELENRPERFHEIIQGISFPSADDPTTNFTFDQSGDAVGKYDILNLVPGDNDMLEYRRIGSWNQGTLDISLPVAFYRNGGLVNGADITTECHGSCSECTSEEFLYASRDGPLQIAGIAAVSGTETCGSLTNSGILDVEAFIFAVDYVNKRSDILPGVELGAKIFDGCGVRAVRELSSYFDGVGAFANRSSTWQRTIGIVGAGVPSTTELVQQTAEQYMLPQISYSFSSGQEGNSSIKTTQSVNAYIQAIKDTLVRLEWTSVAVIADANDETQLLLYNSFLESTTDICVSSTSTFTDINDAVTSLGSTNVILVFASADVINNLSQDAGNHKTFIFAGVPVADTVWPSSATAGSIVLAYSRNSEEFATYLANLVPVDTSYNPWLEVYIGRNLQCNVGGVIEYSRACNEMDHLSVVGSDTVNAKRIIDSVLALAVSFHELQQAKCGSGSTGLCRDLLSADNGEFLNVVRDVNFMVEGQQNVDFRNGTQDLAISVWNIPSASRNAIKLADWNETLPTFDSTPLFFDANDRSSTIESRCLTTPTPTTAEPSTRPASTAPQTETASTPSKKNSRTSKSPDKPPRVTEKKEQQRGDPVPEDNHREVWFILALILSGMGIILTIIVVVILGLNRHSNYAQLHSSLLIYAVIIAIVVMFAESVVFGVAVEGYICALRRILPGASFFIAFSSIFLMAGRYYRILKKERRVSGMGAKYIDNKSQLIALVSMSFVGGTILLQWILYKPPEISMFSSNATDVYLHCRHVDGEFPISFIFIYFLMFGSLVLSVAAMRRSMVFFTKEIKSMIICLVLSAVLAIVWIICSIAKGEEPAFYVPATCFMGILQGYIILLTIFPPIIRGLYKDDQELFFDADTNSVVDGNAGFTNPVTSFEPPYDEPPKKTPPLELDFESPM